jgi:mono/diheme cytochrome c family protein
MTAYLLFVGLGILIYAGVAHTNVAISGFVVLAAVFLSSHANRLLRNAVVALVLFTGGVAIFIATMQALVVPLKCAGPCGAGVEPSAGNSSIAVPIGSQSVAVGDASGRLAAGKTLFQKRGCIGCHRADGTGVGPTLHGLFGSPVQDPTCGVAIVDESYVREAILNPSATVAPGFPAAMPTFAGLLTEEDVQALIAYVRSLGLPG